MTLAELGAHAIADGCPLSAEGTFAKGKRPTWSNGAQAAHVAVDPRTGHVEVVDCLVVEDVGRLINPQIVHGQDDRRARPGPGWRVPRSRYLRYERTDVECVARGLSRSNRDRLSAGPRRHARTAALAEQSVGGQGRQRGRQCSDRGNHRQRRRCRARGVERPTDGIAALAAAAVATDEQARNGGAGRQAQQS